MTYHGLEVPGGRSSDHTHETTGLIGSFDLMFREAFKILADGVNVNRGIGWFSSRGISVDQGKSSFRIFTEVERMEASGGGHEFQYSGLSMDLKNTTTVVTVIGDMMFLSEIKQGENVGDAGFIKVDVDISKISLR